jgi:hypothetical protein
MSPSLPQSEKLMPRAMVRGQNGRHCSGYLIQADIEKVMESSRGKAIRKARITWEGANGTNRSMPLRLASINCYR